MICFRKSTPSILMAAALCINAHSQQITRGPAEKGMKDGSHIERVRKLISQKDWDFLFPHRAVLKEGPHRNTDFYSYEYFVDTAGYFPGFLDGGGGEQNIRELCAYLAIIGQETNGGWKAAPDGENRWALYFIEEKDGGEKNYSDYTKTGFPPYGGKKYYGRGAIQLSWNYNYGQFSNFWFGNKDVLLQSPELLSSDPQLSFASSMWFWTTAQFPKPSCHEVIIGKWLPGEDDLQSGRLAGFGSVVNIVNGGVECNTAAAIPQSEARESLYLYFCAYFHISPGDNLKCSDAKLFGFRQ